MDKRTIEILQIIRGYATLSVYISHFLGDYENVFHFTGQLAVAVFFWISGFLLIHTSYGVNKHYLLKRIIRIVPLYYLMTLFVFIIGLIAPSLLHTADPTIENLIRSLLFVPYRVEGTNEIMPLLTVGWTLYSEIFVAVFFYIGFLLFHSNRKSGIMVIFILVALVCINQGSGTTAVFMNTYGRLVNLYWVTGILFAFYYKKCMKKVQTKASDSCTKYIIVILGLVVFLICENYYRTSFVAILMVSLIMSYVVYKCSDIHFSEHCLLLGKISYSFYLIHYFIVKAVSRIILHDMKSGWILGLAFIISLGITMLASFVSYEMIEKRFASWLKGVLRICS